MGLKNIKIAGEATFAYEKAAATLPAEFKDFIKEKGHHPSKSSVAIKPSGRLFRKKMLSNTRFIKCTGSTKV